MLRRQEITGKSDGMSFGSAPKQSQGQLQQQRLNGGGGSNRGTVSQTQGTEERMRRREDGRMYRVRKTNDRREIYKEVGGKEEIEDAEGRGGSKYKGG